MVVELRYSGGASNQFAVASIGGGMSDSAIISGVLENLFDDVTRVESINGKTEYRKFYVYNNTANTFIRGRMLNLEITENSEISFAIDKEDLDDLQILPAEDSVPEGLSFYKVSDWLHFEVPIGALKPQAKVPIWIKRKVTTSEAAAESIQLKLKAPDDNTGVTEIFRTIHNNYNNIAIKSVSSQFLTDLSFVGEALTS